MKRTLSLALAALAALSLTACSSAGAAAPSAVTPTTAPVAVVPPTTKPVVTPTPVVTPDPTPTADPFTMDDVTEAEASEDCEIILGVLSDENRIKATSDTAVLEASVVVLGRCLSGTYVPEPGPIVKRGTTARSGDWDVKVNGKVNFNAWKKVKAENMFNERAPRGMVMVMVPLRVTNRGSEASALLGTNAYVVGDATGVEITDSCGVIPSPLDAFKTVRPGGTLKGNMCFLVEKTDVKTLRLGWPVGMFSNEPDVEFALR